MNKKRKIWGIVTVVLLLGTAIAAAQKEKDQELEARFKEVYEIYKEQFGEIPEKELEKISKQEFIEAYEKSFWGHTSSKEGVGTRSCWLGDAGAALWWYKPPNSWRVHHWAKAVADAYQLCEHITTGGDCRGCQAFVYEHTAFNTAWTSAQGDGWGHYHWLFHWIATNDVHAHFVVNNATHAWDYEKISGGPP